MRFEIVGERVVVPSQPHIHLCAIAVALSHERARERKLALCSQRRLFGEEGAHRRGLHPLDPQHRLGAPS